MPSITRRLQNDIAGLDLASYYKERICMWPVSKDLRGEFQVAERERQRSAKPDYVSLKGYIRLRGLAQSHAPCDSIMARPLDGDLEGEIVFAYLEDGHRRGYHVGKTSWSARGSILIGRMSGITNAGTHRQPLHDCEACDRRGHMEGCLDAIVADGNHRGCRLIASYAIGFDPGTLVQATGFRGALEGVLICRCEP